MKSLFFALLSLTLLCGCATSYNPISKLESIGDGETSNENLKVTVGIQPLGDNSRFKDKAEEKHITILKLSVQNISNEKWIINPKSIHLVGAANDEIVGQLQASEVADQMSLASGGYWLWGLLWMGYSQNVNGETSGFWLPVGLPIGAINFFRARNTNSEFEEEITSNSFPGGEIDPGQTISGLLFFNRSSGMKYNLVINYSSNTEENKEISIPYKL